MNNTKYKFTHNRVKITGGNSGGIGVREIW